MSGVFSGYSGNLTYCACGKKERSISTPTLTKFWNSLSLILPLANHLSNNTSSLNELNIKKSHTSYPCLNVKHVIDEEFLVHQRQQFL